MNLILWIIGAAAIVGMAVVLFMMDTRDWALIRARGRMAIVGLIRRGMKLIRRVKEFLSGEQHEEEVPHDVLSLSQYRELLEKLADEGRIYRDDIPKYLSGEKELDLGVVGA